MLFSTADDVHASLGQLLHELAADAELGPRLSALDTVVQFRLRQPDTTLTLAVKASAAPVATIGALPEGSAQPELIVTADADVAHALWLGKQNVTIALARGTIQVKGATATIVDLLRMVDVVAPQYEQLLRASGRDDLADAEPPSNTTLESAPSEEKPADGEAPEPTADGENATETADATEGTPEADETAAENGAAESDTAAAENNA